MAKKASNNKSNSKKVEPNSEIEKTFGMKVLVFFGVIISCAICIYLMNYFFVKKSYIKINISTDKKVDYIKINGSDQAIITQKFVSDLNYSMRYDVDTFKVVKYRNQDMYKYVDAEKIFVIVEKGVTPAQCSTPGEEIYNSCMITLDDFSTEYYVTKNKRTYKITVKTPGKNNYKEEIKSRINYMLNSFEPTK